MAIGKGDSGYESGYCWCRRDPYPAASFEVVFIDTLNKNQWLGVRLGSSPGSMAYSSVNDPNLDDDDYPAHWGEEDEEDISSSEQRQFSSNDMDERFPGYSRESKNAGRFLGLNHPYIPGDPDF